MFGQIKFEKATALDVPFIASLMMEAMGTRIMEEGRVPEPHLCDVCRRTDTLYSYLNATIVCTEDSYAGGLISYPGKDYHKIMTHTFDLVAEHLPFDVSAMEDETREGEYYLDSLAVVPAFRKRGIGRQLLEYGIQQANELGLLPVLACDPENTNAYNLYTSMGFKEDGKLFIFGENYLRMVFIK